MTKDEWKEKIKVLIRTVRIKKKEEEVKEEYILLKKFPELREIIVDLLTDQYNLFLDNIDYVSPRPTTFRVVLKNGYNFYLVYTDRSWIAEVEGKSFYLLNLGEEEGAAEAISLLLRYKKVGGEDTAGEEIDIDTETETETEETETEETEEDIE